MSKYFEKCIDCPDRKVLCSVGCEHYEKGRAALDAENAAKRKSQEISGYDFYRSRVNADAREAKRYERSKANRGEQIVRIV